MACVRSEILENSEQKLVLINNSIITLGGAMRSRPVYQPALFRFLIQTNLKDSGAWQTGD